MSKHLFDHRAATDERQHLRRLTQAVIAVFVLGALLAALYAFRFFGPLSSQQEVWGQFGDYLGGVLNPIVGLLTLILFLSNLVFQREQLEASRTDLQEARNSSIKADLFRMAETVFRECEAEADSSRSVVFGYRSPDDPLVRRGEAMGGELHMGQRSLRWVFTVSDYSRDILDPADPRATKFKALVNSWLEFVTELSDYLSSIDELAGGDARASDYFRRRIFPLLNRVHEKGYVSVQGLVGRMTPRTRLS